MDGTGERDHDGGQPQVRGVPQLLQQSGLGVLSDVRNVAVHVNGLAGPAHHQAEVAEVVDDSRMLAGLLQTYCRADGLTQIH